MSVIPLPPNRRVVTLGDFVVDLVCTIPTLPVYAGEHQLADSISLEPGGAGNFLIAGQRLGLEMGLLGAMGDDTLGNLAARLLEDEGVDLSGLLRQPGGTTTQVIVLVDASGKHVFLGKYGTGPEVNTRPEWFARLKNAAALFISGYSLHEERLWRVALNCMKFACAEGIPVFFDPGPHVQGLPTHIIRQALRHSRVLMLTEEEIPLVALPEMGNVTGLEACRRLLTKGPKMVCLKRGAQGSTLLTISAQVEHGGFAVHALDTTAAGDSYAAAFIYAYLCGWSALSMLTFANAMGAAKVRKIGSGTHVPGRDELFSILHEFNESIVEWME